VHRHSETPLKAALKSALLPTKRSIESVALHYVQELPPPRAPVMASVTKIRPWMVPHVVASRVVQISTHFPDLHGLATAATCERRWHDDHTDSGIALDASACQGGFVTQVLASESQPHSFDGATRGRAKASKEGADLAARLGSRSVRQFAQQPSRTPRVLALEPEYEGDDMPGTLAHFPTEKSSMSGNSKYI